MDPYKIADRKLTELQDHFRSREKTLKSYRLSPTAHNQAVARMQQEYDEAKYQTAVTRSQLDDIKRSIFSGEIDSIVGQKAMLSLVAPRETVEAAFPDPVKVRAPQRGRFTPSEFKSYVKEFSDVAKGTIEKPWLAKNYVDPEKLKEEYFNQRARYAYDEDMNPSEKKAFDLAWDQAVYSNKKTATAWKTILKDDPEVFTSRTYDARLLNIAKKKAQGGSVSPMAASLKPKLPPRGYNLQPPLGASALRGEPSDSEVKPIRQRNKRTGQTRVSYDGGKTWQVQ